MIVKITRGSDFSELTAYLVANRDHSIVDRRGVTSMENAADEMARIAETAERARTVVFHAAVSVAIEDGMRSDAFWRTIGDEMDRELGLSAHQRVVVRHRDKAYDHVHIFWCAVNPDTGRTPPKQWFRRKGEKTLAEVGPCALTDAQIATLPADRRVRKSYDSFALKRMQHLCRRLETEHGLRRLRSNAERGDARQQGEARSRRRTQERRAERAGSVPLFERADALRGALDLPDWNARSEALGRLRIGMKLVVRPSKDGPRIRGLILFDAADPGNTLSASDLDLATRRYGLRQIEQRQPDHALAIEYWWPQPGLEAPHVSLQGKPAASATVDVASDHHTEYTMYRDREKERRRHLKLEMRQIRSRQADEIKRLAQALRQTCAQQLVDIDAGRHIEFRRWYGRRIIEPALARMRRIHRITLARLRLGKLHTFAQFRAGKRPDAPEPSAAKYRDGSDEKARDATRDIQNTHATSRLDRSLESDFETPDYVVDPKQEGWER